MLASNFGKLYKRLPIIVCCHADKFFSYINFLFLYQILIVDLTNKYVCIFFAFSLHFLCIFFAFSRSRHFTMGTSHFETWHVLLSFEVHWTNLFPSQYIQFKYGRNKRSTNEPTKLRASLAYMGNVGISLDRTKCWRIFSSRSKFWLQLIHILDDC